MAKVEQNNLPSKTSSKKLNYHGDIRTLERTREKQRKKRNFTCGILFTAANIHTFVTFLQITPFSSFSDDHASALCHIHVFWSYVQILNHSVLKKKQATISCSSQKNSASLFVLVSLFWSNSSSFVCLYNGLLDLNFSPKSNNIWMY